MEEYHLDLEDVGEYDLDMDEVEEYDLDLEDVEEYDMDLDGFEHMKSSCQQFESTWVRKQKTSPVESGCNKKDGSELTSRTKFSKTIRKPPKKKKPYRVRER